MKYLVFEDEEIVSDMLIQLINQCRPTYELITVLSSIKSGINWLNNNPMPDIIFMDIQLSDGICFEIFNEIKIEAPIIFTTAYDQYAIRAFKVNSIDYLVKPIDYNELKVAIDKFEKFNVGLSPSNQTIYNKVWQELKKSYKQRFLVKIGEQLKYINTENIAYIIYDDRLVTAISFEGKKYILDQNLEKTYSLLNPNQFFQINRKCIISLKSIEKIHTYFNHRFKLQLKPPIDEEIIVSRERVADFKCWLDK